MRKLKGQISRLVSMTPVQYIPVTVRGGLAKGARWTLLPYSANWRGHAERDVENAIRLCGDMKGAVCWDLGTHFGVFTVGMAMAVGPTGQVVGVEPDLFSYRRCKRHVGMNNLSWVMLLNVAASDAARTTTLVTDRGAGASTSHLAYEGEDVNRGVDTMQVKTVVMDELVEGGVIRPPRLIKIDVEGHGAKALFGAQRTLAAHLPTIVMSFHSPWEVNETRQLLEPLGYECLDCDGIETGWPDDSFRNTLILRPRAAAK